MTERLLDLQRPAGRSRDRPRRAAARSRSPTAASSPPAPGAGRLHARAHARRRRRRRRPGPGRPVRAPAASRATSTRACSSRSSRRRSPAASPAWSARPTPTRCSTSRAWSRCSSSAPASSTSRRVFPLGALTRGLAGEALTEMAELTEAGCVGSRPGRRGAARHRWCCTARCSTRRPSASRMWLRPNDAWLGGGVAANGPLATRMGLSGVPVLAETIALAHDLRAGARHRRARPPVPPEQRRRRRAGAPRQGRGPAGELRRSIH